MKRQPLLRAAGITAAATILAVGTLTGCGSSGGNSASGNGPSVLRVTLANHVWTDTIKAAIPEFEKANNVKVELTQLGEDQLSDQYNVKLNAGTDEIDVMMYRPLQEGKTFAKNGYLADLTDKVKADSSWDWSDFQAGPVSSTSYEGKVVGVPTITEREVLYYRKDLLEKAGLPVPTTMEELQADAQKIKDA
ncbi:MAG TPA: extracellular solute-binding protein, partial [Micrococcaceae bacterium]|nr:extracellular solute-binding protein [Micrococcaceae bacterium]